MHRDRLCQNPNKMMSTNMEKKLMAYRLKTFNMHSDLQERKDTKECSNYRTVALISQASKVILKAMQQRLLPYMEQDMMDILIGFIQRRDSRSNCEHLMDTRVL